MLHNSVTGLAGGGLVVLENLMVTGQGMPIGQIAPEAEAFQKELLELAEDSKKHKYLIGECTPSY